MNILKRLPDDLQEVIYKNIHRLNMKSIKNELDDELDKRWNKKSIDTQDYYIDAYYHTENSIYSLYQMNNNKYIRPDKIAFYGNFRIVERINDDGDIYKSHLLINPTYADILLKVDEMIKLINDTDDIFLEHVSLGNKLFDNEYNEYIQTINILLGS